MPPGMSLPGGFPEGLMDAWWRDPATAARLHLNEDQKRQLETAMLNQRLALIDIGADALKSFTRLGVMLDAERFDEAAYNQQIGALSTAAGNLVQMLGAAAATPRKVLTDEQWREYTVMQRSRRAAQSIRVNPSPGLNAPLARPPVPR